MLKKTGVETVSSRVLEAQWLDLEELLEFRADWEELAREAIDPNPLYETDYLAASIRHLQGQPETKLLAVWSGSDRSRLAGLFPVQKRWLKDGFLWPVTTLYFSDYAIVTVPLIASDEPEKVWQVALDAIAASCDMPSLLCLTKFYGKRAVASALKETIGRGGLSSRVLESFERPIVESDLDCQSYALRWSSKKRKNISRSLRQMEGFGEVSFVTVTPDDAGFAGALDDFLSLEASGWKGRNGTALTCSPDLEAFAREAFGSGREAPVVHFDQMLLDGRVIASNANLVSQGAVFCMKNGYDESFSKQSPGVLVDRHLLCEALDEKRYGKLDSCAGDDHYLSSMWLERETVEMVVLATNAKTGKWQLALIETGFRVYRKLKAFLSELRTWRQWKRIKSAK